VRLRTELTQRPATAQIPCPRRPGAARFRSGVKHQRGTFTKKEKMSEVKIWDLLYNK